MRRIQSAAPGRPSVPFRRRHSYAQPEAAQGLEQYRDVGETDHGFALLFIGQIWEAVTPHPRVMACNLGPLQRAKVVGRYQSKDWW
jgi:hypothetical protein